MSYSALKTIKAQRDALVTEMRGHIDEAEKREGGWIADDDTKVAGYEQSLTEMDQRSTVLLAAMERAADENEAVSRALDKAPAPQAEDSFDSEVREFVEGKRRNLVAKRDLSKLSAGAGLNTVRTSFYDQLVEHMIDSSAVLKSGATIVTTTTGENIQVPVTTTHPTAILVAETAAITESDPVFAQRTLGAFKYALITQISSELAQDTSINLIEYLSRVSGRAVGNGFGVHAITGTGTTQPFGIVTSAATGVTGGIGVVGVFTADNLIDLYYSVIEGYRNDPSCGWLLRDASVATLRKLKDSAGQYLWSPATEPGKPDMFLGKPVRTDPNVAATGLNAKSVVFGAFSAYMVRQVNEVRFERSDEFAFNQDLITFRTVARLDGVTTDQSGALKVFAGGAS
jgi:HK97 family phage major capsid protein